MADSPLDKLKQIAGTQAPTVPRGGISALKQKLEGMGFEPKPLPAEVTRANMTSADRGLANVYNLGQATVQAATEVAASPLEALGQLTQSETLRGAAEGIRGWADYDERMMAYGQPLVEPGFGSEVAGAVGSAAGFIGGGALMGGARVLTGGGRLATGLLGAGSKGAAARLGAVTQAQAMYRDAEAEGASLPMQYAAFFAGAPLGALEGATIGGSGQLGRLGEAFAKIDTRSGGELGAALRGFVRIGGAGAAEALEEGAQEGVQTFSEQLIAQRLLAYAEPEEWDVILEETRHNALLGAIVGQGLGSLGVVAEDLGTKRQLKKLGREIEAQGSPESTQSFEREKAEAALESAKSFEREKAPEALSVEDAGKRFAQAAGISAPEVAVLDPGQETKPGQEALAGLVSMLGRESTGTTMPPIVLVSGEVAEGAPDVPGLYIGGNVVLNANRVDEVLADYGMHEILHSKIPAGTQQFSELVARALESYPELAARVAGAYARDFEQARGQKPFAGIAAGPKRDALLLEEGFAWAAQNTRALVEDIVGGEREITVGDRTLLERLRDFFAALLSKLPRIDIKSTEKKNLEAAIRKLVSVPILQEGSPDQVLALAKDIAGVLKSTDADVLRAAGSEISWLDTIKPMQAGLPQAPDRPRLKASEAIDLEGAPKPIQLGRESTSTRRARQEAEREAEREATLEGPPGAQVAELAEVDVDVDAEADQARDKQREPVEPGAPDVNSPTPPDIDERLTPKQRRRIKQKRNRAAKDAIERFDRGDERWAVAPDPEVSIDMGGLSFSDRARRYWQDYFRPVRKVQEMIEEDIGASLPDDMNPSRMQRLYYGRVDEALKRQRDSAGKQLASILGDKITLEEAHRFAYALHAGERNAFIFENDAEWHPERNPGSGIRSSVATKTVNDLLGGPNAARYKRLDRFLRRQTEKALSTLRDAGELSPALDEAIRQQGYKRYVPLVHEMEREDGSVTRRNPRGFSSTGAGVKRARGRKSEPDNVVLNTLKSVDEAIFKAEKRQVLDSLVKLVRAYPDDSFWKVYDMPVRIEADEEGVMRELWETRRDWQDSYLPLYENGEGKALVFGPKATGLARAMRGGDLNKIGPIVKAIQPVTRYFSAINTSLNPEFVFSNFTRDLQTAGLVLGEDKGWSVAKSIVQRAPSAVRGIRRAETGQESDWAPTWSRLKAAGGKTGFFHAKSLEEIQADLERTIRDEVGQKSGVRAGLDYARKVKEFVDGWNEAVENGVRLAAFRYAVEELGLSDAQGAELSKTLTIDFNTRGENTALSALYMFANASIQGSARVLASSVRTSRGRKISGSIAAFGMLLDPLNYMLAGEDDDGESRWDAVPEWKKDRYLMLYTGVGEGGFLTIPLPYGFSFFYSAGRNASAVARGIAGEGGVTPMEGFGNTLSSALTSFSPVGDAHNISSASALRVLSPTITDPLVEVAMNEDYRGMPIHPRGVPFDRTPLPDSQQSFKHTGEIWKDAAALMNSATGGTRLEAGKVDLHPDTLRHLFGTAFGGMMRFANNTAEGLGLAPEGDPLHALSRAPFSRQLFTQEYPRKGYSSYYENSTEVLVVADLIEQYGRSTEAEDRERAQDLREEYGEIAGLMPEVKRLERIRKRAQDRIEAMEDGDAREAEEAKLYERIRAFNRRFQDLKKN